MARVLTKVTQASATVPALFAREHNAASCFLELFTVNIRNPNTRKAYARAAVEFAAWCDQNGLCELRDIEPVQVAARGRKARHRYLRSTVEHYNRVRAHSSLGHGVPDSPQEIELIRKLESRHGLAAGSRLLNRSWLACITSILRSTTGAGTRRTAEGLGAALDYLVKRECKEDESWRAHQTDTRLLM